MRLITRKIYRAFPELDKFSDEQCERFLQAANASIVRRMCRGAVSFGFAIVVGLLALVGAVYAAQELADHWRLDGFLYWLLFGVLTTTALVIAFLPGLILADGLLRLRVRSLLKRCGTCPQCSYSLLGIRVGADLIVTCPECGRKVQVDPAFDELATDETGARVYRPQAFRLDAETIARRRRRRRWILKWSAIGVGSVVLLLASGYGVFWGFLSWQARDARAARNTMTLMREHQAKAWPGVVDVDSNEEWKRYVEIVDLVSKIETEAVQSGRYKTESGESVYFDFEVIRPGVTRETYKKERQLSEGSDAYDAARRLVLDMIETARKDGACARMREIATLRAPLRELTDPGSRSFWDSNTFDGLGASRAMARLNAARMVAALNAGERAEYLEALEQTLAAGRIVEMQGYLIDRMVANAIRMLAVKRVTEDARHYPDSAWFDEVLRVLARYQGRTPLAWTFEAERIAMVDYLHWVFSDPGRVRNLHFGIRNEETPEIDAPVLGIGPGPTGSLGTHERNVEAMNRIMGQFVAAAEMPMEKWSPPVPAVTGLILVDSSVGYFGRTFKSDAQLAYDYRAGMFAIAIERFRHEHKRLPQQSELATMGLPPDVFIDPLNGKPFGVRERFGPFQDEQPFVIYGGDQNPDSPAQAE